MTPMRKCAESISLIVPVYNEGEMLEGVIKGCIETLEKDFKDFELILIDDGSADGTGDLMDKIAAGNKRVKVLHNLVNMNVGISVQRGFASATKTYVVHNAVDFPLAVSDIRPLVEKMDGVDVLVLERTSYAGYTLWRWVTSKANRLLMRLIYRAGGIRDMNFTQVYRREVLPSIMPLSKSPSFTTPEMIIRAIRSGLNVKGEPVRYIPRSAGKGAFGRPHDMLWSFYDMLRFRLRY